MEHPRPLTMVDVVLFTIVEDTLSVVLEKRANAPFRGRFALPGGYIHVDEDEDAEASARRVLAAKCGVGDVYLEQLYTFTGRARDPRDWSVTIAYCAVAPAQRVPARASTKIVPLTEATGLPFDHDRILARAATRLRDKATYSSLPGFLLPETFTYPQLQRVYEVVTGEHLDTSSFRRKTLELRMIEPVPSTQERGGRGRPAQLYRLADQTLRAYQRKI
jgi:8-oxo-dGTP diphosphatase